MAGPVPLDIGYLIAGHVSTPPTYEIRTTFTQIDQYVDSAEPWRPNLNCFPFYHTFYHTFYSTIYSTFQPISSTPINHTSILPSHSRAHVTYLLSIFKSMRATCRGFRLSLKYVWDETQCNFGRQWYYDLIMANCQISYQYCPGRPRVYIQNLYATVTKFDKFIREARQDYIFSNST